MNSIGREVVLLPISPPAVSLGCQSRALSLRRFDVPFRSPIGLKIVDYL